MSSFYYLFYIIWSIISQNILNQWANIRKINDYVLPLQLKIARTGCISAKNELFALNLHRPCAKI